MTDHSLDDSDVKFLEEGMVPIFFQDVNSDIEWKFIYDCFI